MDGDLIRQTFSPKKTLLLRQLQDSSLAKLLELVVNLWTSLWLTLNKNNSNSFKNIMVSMSLYIFQVMS